MEYQLLGQTDLNVSKICLGTMTFGQQNTEEEAHDQLDYAIDCGINFIDTAEYYAVPGRPETQGLTEQYIGSWLKKRGRRDDIVLATKITGPGDALTYIRPDLGFGKRQIMEAIDLSLKRLQTDYIDLYQFHWPERNANFFGKLGYQHDPNEAWDNNISEALAVIQQLVQLGKVRYIGISNETPWGMMEYLRVAEKNGLPRVASIQNPYSLLNRSFEVGLAEMSIREQVPLLAYSPLGFGLLSGKYHQKKDVPQNRLNQFSQMSRYSNDNCWSATEAYLEIAKRYALDPAQMSLSFVNDQLFTGANIIGATDMDQLKDNIASIDLKLSKEILAALDKVQIKYPNPAP